MTKQEYFFKEGCYIQEWHNKPSDNSLSVAHIRVEPKKTTKLHCLKNTVERYIILDGDALITVGERSWKVRKSDVVVIDPSVPQKIENLLDSDLLFLAVCTPRFEEGNYQQLED